ncbi:CHAT domain-containing protein [Amylostereum chailletii]|nr:CHAT domain-containing protein [Amylostereum chailletii]
MQSCPPEIHAHIFSFACTDEGQTGCALSLVSRYVRNASRPYQWQTLALVGVSQTKRFASTLPTDGTNPVISRPISHLFLSNRQEEDARELRFYEVRATCDITARRRIDTAFNHEADEWGAAIRRIFAYAAGTLGTLSLMCYDVHLSPKGRLFFSDIKGYSFPVLEEMTIRGGLDTWLRDDEGQPRWDKTPEEDEPRVEEEKEVVPTLPRLKKLHLVTPVSFDLFIRRIHPLAPNISHLRLSELLAFDYDMSKRIFSELVESGVVPPLLPGLEDQKGDNATPVVRPVEWNRFLPPQHTLKRLIIQPSQLPESNRVCACCSGYFKILDMTALLREMARSAYTDQFVYLPAPAKSYTFAQGLDDWRGRLEGRKGCWVERADVDVDVTEQASAETKEGWAKPFGTRRSMQYVFRDFGQGKRGPLGSIKGLTAPSCGWYPLNMSSSDSGSHLKLSSLLGGTAEDQRDIVSNAAPGKEPKRLQRLLFLAVLWRKKRDMKALNTSIAFSQEALQLCSNPEYEVAISSCLANLGIAYYRRYQKGQNKEDLNQAVHTFEAAIEAVAVTDDVVYDALELFAKIYTNLATVLLHRFADSGGAADLDMAVKHNEMAVNLTLDEHPVKTTYLDNLAMALRQQHAVQKNVEALDRSIQCSEQAFLLTPDFVLEEKVARLVTLLETLSVYLGMKARNESRDSSTIYFSDSETIADACERYAAWVPTHHPSKPRCTSIHSHIRYHRWRRYRTPEDLDRAIASLELTNSMYSGTEVDQEDRLQDCALLGLAYYERFSGNTSHDLDRSIRAWETALNITTDDHPKRIYCAQQLSEVYNLSYHYFGDLHCLDKSIALMQSTVERLGTDHLNAFRPLATLFKSFLLRFYRLGDRADVKESIRVLKAAISVPGASTRYGPDFDDLQTQFEAMCSEYPEDAQPLLGTSAPPTVSQPPSNSTPTRSEVNSLLFAAVTRYQQDSTMRNLDDVVDLMKQSISMGSSSEYSHHHAAERFKQTKQEVDLVTAIQAIEQANEFHPREDSGRARRLDRLGRLLYARHKITGDTATLARAAESHRDAAIAIIGQPSKQLEAARQWGRLSLLLNDTQGAVEAYGRALHLVARLAWLGNTIVHRHHDLANISTIAREAAGAALAVGLPETAVEWLEQGRSVVWGQLLSLRTPLVDALHKRNPVLGNRLKQIANELEDMGTRTDSFLGKEYDRSQEEVAQRHRTLADEWERTAEEVRKIDGFEEFLRPQRLSTLLCAAQEGPVVLLTVNGSRCDALIITEDSGHPVSRVPLDNFTEDKAKQLQKKLREILATSSFRARDARATSSYYSKSDNWAFRRMLAILWTDIVYPVLEALKLNPISPGETPPRLWWCPTGPLAFLPIHAAGLYDETGAGLKVFEYVVSSYTPTLMNLVDARRRRIQQNPSSPARAILAVSQPATLPNTTVEIEAIKELVEPGTLRWLDDREATKHAVLTGMVSHNWIHLACHGKQDVQTPTQSALILADGSLPLIDIVKEHHECAAFAFLSACQTATGDEKLSDEAVHLAAGMLMAGYRSVIGTMWSVLDKDAPVVARGVYEHLLRSEEMDETDAANALHHATMSLREKVGEQAFLEWTPFIHLGV